MSRLQAWRCLVVQVSLCRTGDPRVLEEREQDSRERRGACSAQGTGGSFNRISKPRTAQLFSAAAEAWLKAKIAHLSPRSVIIERANLKHINPYFGKMLLCDVAADDIARYQAIAP